MSEEIGRKVMRLFVGTPRRRRAKPNRCLGCGKVTKHIFCPQTYAECRALFEAKR